MERAPALETPFTCNLGNLWENSFKSYGSWGDCDGGMFTSDGFVRGSCVDWAGCGSDCVEWDSGVLSFDGFAWGSCIIGCWCGLLCAFWRKITLGNAVSSEISYKSFVQFANFLLAEFSVTLGQFCTWSVGPNQTSICKVHSGPVPVFSGPHSTFLLRSQSTWVCLLVMITMTVSYLTVVEKLACWQGASRTTTNTTELCHSLMESGQDVDHKLYTKINVTI